MIEKHAIAHTLKVINDCCEQSLARSGDYYSCAMYVVINVLIYAPRFHI